MRDTVTIIFAILSIALLCNMFYLIYKLIKEGW
jgi:hypothetical protein